MLAGGKILKTVRIDDASCVEDFNLRNSALSHAWNAPGGGESSRRHGRGSDDATAVQHQTFDIEDVAWSNGPFSSHIATAAANGRIMLYDIERPGVEVCPLQEHTRQVHKVDFSPLEGRFLLSGSQDGTVRLWDLRNVPKTSTTFQGRADGVRHTKWSPTSTWYFALGTDSGSVQRWDIRQTKAPVLRIAAHSGTCNSIDWHPDGKHLVSAGKDQIVKIWNVVADRRPRKAAFQFMAPYEVQNVRWRPPCYVAQSSDVFTKQCTHLATSYRAFPAVHVWDLRRPYVPFKEIYHQVNHGTTDMLWHSKDLLWAVGSEGEFSQTDVPFSPKTIDRRPSQVFSQSPIGEIAFFSQLGDTQGKDESLEEDDPQAEDARSGFPSSPTTASSRPVQGDDSYEEKFLSTSYGKRHSRTPSMKSTRSFGSTPPSIDDFAKPVVHLDETMRIHEGLLPQQSSLIGIQPGVEAHQLFGFLADDRKTHLDDSKKAVAKADRFRKICEEKATRLQRVNRFRDAQVWKILALQICRDLQRRTAADVATSHERDDSSVVASQPVAAPTFARGAQHLITKGSATTGVGSSRSVGSTSNVPTPLARPVRSHISSGSEPHSDVEDNIQLPDSLVSQRFHQSNSNSISQRSFPTALKPTGSAEARRQDLMSSYRGPSKTPLDLGSSFIPSERDVNLSPLNRHNSGDSFMMFSTSSESQRRSTGKASMENSFSFHDGSWHSNVSDSTGHRANGSSHERSGRRDQFGEEGDVNGRFESEDGHNSSRRQSEDDEVVTGKLSGSFEPQREIEKARNLVRSSTRDNIDVEDVSPPKQFPKPEKAKHSDTASLEMIPGSIPSIQDLTRAGVDSGFSSTTGSEVVISGIDLGLDEESWEVIDIFSQLLESYSSTDAQMAAHLYICCAAFILPPAPDYVDTDLIRHHPALRSIYHHLTDSVAFSAATAKDIVSSSHLLLEELGIASTAVEAFMSTYHSQLVSSRLSLAATRLRRFAYPSFPAVYEQALSSIDSGLLCTQCKSPINNGVDQMQCETCNAKQADCAVCTLPESPYPLQPASGSAKRREANASMSTPSTPIASLKRADPRRRTNLWTSCALCNHASHTACAYVWYADEVGGGACPTMGCLCDCAPGPYREQKLSRARLESETQAQVRWHPGSAVSISVHASDGPAQSLQVPSSAAGGVRKDDWSIGPSRAVRSVTRDLREGAFSDGEYEGRGGEGRPRRAGREDVPARRVRLVEPGAK